MRRGAFADAPCRVVVCAAAGAEETVEIARGRKGDAIAACADGHKDQEPAIRCGAAICVIGGGFCGTVRVAGERVDPVAWGGCLGGGDVVGGPVTDEDGIAIVSDRDGLAGLKIWKVECQVTRIDLGRG